MHEFDVVDAHMSSNTDSTMGDGNDNADNGNDDKINDDLLTF